MEEEVFFTTPMYEFGEDSEAIMVSNRCPECMRFMKVGEVIQVKNGFKEHDHWEFEKWTCKHCGEIKPQWYWKADVWDDNKS